MDDFIKDDRDGENDAINLYRKIISEALKRGDTKTRKIFEEIVGEEEHYWQFDDYLP